MRPCVHNRLCAGCEHYQPYRQRVCVIKLGALGDVIRTLSILPELHKRYADAHVTWVTRPNAACMIDGHPLIHRVLTLDATTRTRLHAERHDVLICLDKEPDAAALAAVLPVAHTLGITLSEWGTAVPANDAAHDYFLLGLSDELKFRRNRKSYPQLIHEALGWAYAGQRYELPLDAKNAAEANETLEGSGWTLERPSLGINVGAGSAFANKMWPAERTRQLLEHWHEAHPGVQVLLLGGPHEREMMDQLHRDLPWSIHTGTDNAERRFVALVNACDVLFSGDTMAMHVAIALQRGVVAWFGPTCEQEIDLFGLGEKLVADVPCGPCYRHTCLEGDACIGMVPIEDAIAAIERVLVSRRPDAIRSRVPEPIAAEPRESQVQLRAAG